MKKRIVWILFALVFTLCACSNANPSTGPTQAREPVPTESTQTESTEPIQTESTQTESTEPIQTESTQPAQTQATEPEPVETIAAQPEHSPLYIPELPVEDVILYFNEVVLDGEFINSGDPSFVQKWTGPISYTLEGNYTDQDAATIDTFVNWLNGMEGFKGMHYTTEAYRANLRILFCSQEEMVSQMGTNFTDMDGGVTFWYSDNQIYDAIICCRDDVDQELRNSVILEEIYNGLGPIQDTTLRPDSLIYQEYSTAQWLSPVDELIIQLLYHPDIKPGMDAQQCEEIIRSLYY